jgi:nicotinamidase-related amidase
MASLFALLSQNSTNLQTRKGLIILGLQNDFMSPNGKLPVTDTKFLDSISELVPAFREFGHVIWVRSEFAATRPVHAVDSIGDVVIAGGSSGMDPALDFSDDEEEDAKEGSGDRRASPKTGKV